jgi:ADP-ribose pyrophosphatase YjhB (NUDIX family)
MQWNDAKPCASALVVSDSRLLMVRRARDPWRGTWDVPGGFCAAGEHPMETATREVLEETGLEVRVVGLLGMWLDRYEEPGSAAKATLNIYYHAVPAGPLVLAPDASEVAEAGFFDASRLPGPLAFPGHVPTALDAWRRAAASGHLVTPLFDDAAGTGLWTERERADTSR